MANWKEVQERWLPIVEKMEEHSMDDYAIPEIYRAAEERINFLEDCLAIATGNAEEDSANELVAGLKKACDLFDDIQDRKKDLGID